MEVKSLSQPVVVSLVLLALPILGAIMGLFRKNGFVVAGRTVLLTGGSQGMGRGLGRLLAQKGANVIIVARTESKLIEAVEYIKAAASSPSQRFTYVAADLTKPEENERVLKVATEWNNGAPPDIIWANAGSAYPHIFAETSIEQLRSQMDIDYWAAAYLARASIQLWTSNSTVTRPSKEDESNQSLPRHFVITSSVAAFAGLTGYAPYAPAKAALRCLADTLAQEFQLYNGARKASNPATYPIMKSHIVFPAAIASPGYEQENKVKHPVTLMLEEADGEPQTEDEVARASIKGLERGDFMIATNFLGNLMRTGAMGASPRNGWGVLDTLTGWLAYVVWLIIGPDMDRKVFNWGKKHGIEGISKPTIKS